ncbi:hypothetical protein CEXT_767991 [Caerostris extrusa]|uniref:Uncharacterized protein n=1 Tax=Caerostris extrusa TaxID=172846 RepID=A0AAV4W9G1_CAEEX|nr:hypothetical protein CEXT_767991 [Caerostris extrusa]
MTESEQQLFPLSNEYSLDEFRRHEQIFRTKEGMRGGGNGIKIRVGVWGTRKFSWGTGGVREDSQKATWLRWSRKGTSRLSPLVLVKCRKKRIGRNK